MLCQNFNTCPDDKDFQDYLVKSFAALANYSLPFTLEQILDLLIKYEVDAHVSHIWSLLDKSFIRSVAFDRALEIFSKMELFVNSMRRHTSPFTKSWVLPFGNFVSLLITNAIIEHGSPMEMIDSAETIFLKMYQSWLICDPEVPPPWNKSPTDIDIASKFLSTFFDSLNKFLGLTHYVGMTKLWRFLTMDTRLIACAPPTHVHIQDTVFDVLSKSEIKWENWRPILEDVEYIASLIQYICVLPQENIPGNMIKFLCIIACNVRWEIQDFMGDYRLPHFQELFLRWNALSLLCKPIQENLRKQLSARALDMDWNKLPIDKYACVLNDIIEILSKIRSETGFEAGTRCNNMIKFLATTCGCYNLVEDSKTDGRKMSVSLSTCATRFYSFVKLFAAALELGLPTQDFSGYAINGIMTISTDLAQNELVDQAFEELFKLLNKPKTRQLVSDGIKKSLETYPQGSLPILKLILKAVSDPLTLVQEGENVISFFVNPSTQSKIYKEETPKLWEDVISTIPQNVVESDSTYVPIINAATEKGTGLFLFALTQKLLLRNKDFSGGRIITNFNILKNKEHTFVLVVLSALEKIYKEIQEDPSNGQYARILSAIGDTLSTLSLDRKKDGITGLLGFGQPSIYTSSFRLFAKITSLFVQAQVVNYGKIRTQPGDPYGDNYAGILKNLKSTSYILKDKNYTKEMKPDIMSDILREFEQLIQNRNTTIKEYNQVLSLLVHNIYPNRLELVLAFEIEK